LSSAAPDENNVIERESIMQKPAILIARKGVGWSELFGGMRRGGLLPTSITN